MDSPISRRRLVGAALALPLISLSACAGFGGLGMEDAIRRLMTLSSQRAFSQLPVVNGLFAHDMVRIALTPELGGNETPTFTEALQIGSGWGRASEGQSEW